jgi:hypothetical protein
MASVVKESSQSGQSFGVIDMTYPCNAIFARGLINTFEVTLHSAYLYLKILAIFGVISVFGS